MIIRDAVDLWLSQYKPTTRESYKPPINAFMSHVGDGKLITELTPSDMARYQIHIENRDYKPGTIRKHLVTTKVFLNWCYKMHLIEKKVGDFLHPPRTPRRISREAAMQDDDLSVLLTYLTNNPSLDNCRNYAMFRFIADTGCRAGGAAGLKIHSLDFDKLEATVIEKGDKVRQVAFTEECARALKVWLMRRPICDHDHVFISLRTKNRPVSGNYIGLILRRTVKKVERDLGIVLRNRNLHSLRHRVGHKMFDEGAPASLVATALGHESVETTLAYYAPDDWATAADLLRRQSLPTKRSLDDRHKIEPFPNKKSGANS